MAEQLVFIGSMGPFLFDDADQYDDGAFHAAIHSASGKATIGGAPTVGSGVLRLSDIASTLEESKRYALLVG